MLVTSLSAFAPDVVGQPIRQPLFINQLALTVGIARRQSVTCTELAILKAKGLSRGVIAKEAKEPDEVVKDLCV